MCVFDWCYNENGGWVFVFVDIVVNDGDYVVVIKVYEYIVDEKGL